MDEAESKPTVVVKRIDSNAASEKGDYQCQVPGCGWMVENATRNAARLHVKRHHRGSTLEIRRLVDVPRKKRPYLQTEEEKKDSKAAKIRRITKHER